MSGKEEKDGTLGGRELNVEHCDRPARTSAWALLIPDEDSLWAGDVWER